MSRCFFPFLLTCIAFACGNPTYVGDDDGGNPIYGSTGPIADDGGADPGDSGSPEPDAGPGVCISDAGAQPDFKPDKTCAVLATCGAIFHHLDCCGSTVIVGIDNSKLTEAQAQEASWRTTLAQNCKACAPCDAGLSVTEDGKSGAPDAATQVACVGTPPNGLCETKRP